MIKSEVSLQFASAFNTDAVRTVSFCSCANFSSSLSSCCVNIFIGNVKIDLIEKLLSCLLFAKIIC